MKFKDACDICKKFDYLKTIDDKCICSKCFLTYQKQKNQKIAKEVPLNKRKNVQLDLFSQ